LQGEGVKTSYPCWYSPYFFFSRSLISVSRTMSGGVTGAGAGVAAVLPCSPAFFDASRWSRSLLIVLTSMNTTKAMTKKSMTFWMKTPYMMATSADCSVASAMMIFKSTKLTPPRINPMKGIRMSFTKEFTMAVNAPPIMIPTARSITLPREMNFLNSANMLRFSAMESSLDES